MAQFIPHFIGGHHVRDRGRRVSAVFNPATGEQTGVLALATAEIVRNEEIFGPVLSVVRADSFDAAAQMINQCAFGNGAAIFTRDGDEAT